MKIGNHITSLIDKREQVFPFFLFIYLHYQKEIIMEFQKEITSNDIFTDTREVDVIVYLRLEFQTLKLLYVWCTSTFNK